MSKNIFKSLKKEKEIMSILQGEYVVKNNI